MKIKLTEKDLTVLISRVIDEQTELNESFVCESDKECQDATGDSRTRCDIGAGKCYVLGGNPPGMVDTGTNGGVRGKKAATIVTTTPIGPTGIKPGRKVTGTVAESDLRRLIHRVINESNIVNEQAFDQGLFMSSMNGDANAQCMLCKQMYMFDASKKQSRCMCSTCPCSGQWQQQLQCAICNHHYASSNSKRNKYCKCSSCVCSAGWGTGGNYLGVDSGLSADIPMDDYDNSIKYQGVDSGLSADEYVNDTMGESDLRRLIQKAISEGGEILSK
jgi:hypothetical protein